MKLINTLNGHNGCINALSSFSYFDSEYLISGSSDSKVKIWNHQTSSNQALFELKTNHTDSIQAIAYENRLHYLAIGSKDKHLSLWKRIDEYEGINLKTIKSFVYALAILPNSYIVSGRADQNIINICQSESPYKCIANLTGHTNRVKTLATLPNNSKIISGSYDNMNQLYL